MINKNRKVRELISPRVGFHYFPDTTHYTNKDLSTWLPILEQLKTGWLVLLSDAARAIPEQFLTGLLNAGITPLIHFRLPLPNSPAASDMKAILAAYAHWGVKHVIFFDKPNMMQSWSPAGWVQQDLIERFIDRFLPLAVAASQAGMMPVFPPLEPVGSYWDLSFLKQSLQSLQRRGYSNLVEQMGLASYAYTYNHELDYGAGGPDKWPKSLPYVKSVDSEDQRGFRNYEWLQSAALSACGQELPVFMLGAGVKEPGSPYTPEIHAGICLNILERLKGSSPENAIPDYVKSCNFFLLSAESESEVFTHAWFKTKDDVLPIVDLLLPAQGEEKRLFPRSKKVNPREYEGAKGEIGAHPIDHYLLLPLYEWGIADFHLEVTRPFIQKYHPTVGFSIEEASLAQRVTVIGGEQTFPEEVLSGLRASGSTVDRISGDGISIATQLSER